MNLAIEYLVRKGLTKNLLCTPVSLFYNRAGCRRGKVVCIHAKENGYIVKHWYLSACLSNRALPSMKEFYSTDPFTDPNVILSRPFSLLQYNEKPVPDCQNDWRNPMPEYLYDSFCDSFLCSDSHRRARQHWLWNAFMHTYHHRVENPFEWRFSHTGRSKSYKTSQMSIIREMHPNSWKRWKLWQKHMEFDTLHAELVFTLPSFEVSE